MTIETKFNIGDEFWVMKDNKPIKDRIAQMGIQVFPFKEKNIVIRYYGYVDERKGYFDFELVLTKEELLASL